MSQKLSIREKFATNSFSPEYAMHLKLHLFDETRDTAAFNMTVTFKEGCPSEIGSLFQAIGMFHEVLGPDILKIRDNNPTDNSVEFAVCGAYTPNTINELASNGALDNVAYVYSVERIKFGDEDIAFIKPTRDTVKPSAA